ncbi:hypothetical protein JHN59_39655 [Streptomyces sp. MBT49]|uniref:hypothetical protein n=1 Tax=Streptomyces sp. MBT49 TaxID=1488380 RepID=UPI00190CB8D1|nr:hypothetical protein [Streptomyces sp. MBT49]MBK3630809.1 hypothetical protein [Streptomyces sp. MBT49]
MGSLRNPVGPLPSSIYWRRRVVLLSVFALLALIALWVVTSGGGGKDNGADGGGGKNPASSITPGPSGSGPAISQAPGGRDESSAGSTGGSDGGSGTGSGGGSGSGGAGGDSAGAGDTDDGANGSDGDGGGGVASGVGTGTGAVLPASTTLPNCTAGSVALTLSSVRNAYSPDQTPTFRLTAKNSSGSDCKVDVGPKSAVLTITQTGGTDPYWSSADCPKAPASRLYRVPAQNTFTYTVKWDRKPSAPECATPPAGAAGAGTYLLEAKAPGFAKAQTSFVLKDD